jgi:hypothetical protein
MKESLNSYGPKIIYLSGDATNTNFKVFSLTQLGCEPTIYRTRGEHTNHYTTDAVVTFVYCGETNILIIHVSRRLLAFNFYRFFLMF